MCLPELPSLRSHRKPRTGTGRCGPISSVSSRVVADSARPRTRRESLCALPQLDLGPPELVDLILELLQLVRPERILVLLLAIPSASPALSTPITPTRTHLQRTVHRRLAIALAHDLALLVQRGERLGRLRLCDPVPQVRREVRWVEPRWSATGSVGAGKGAYWRRKDGSGT